VSVGLVGGGSRKRCGHRTASPLNLGPDHIDDLIRQAGNVLMAEVDGDSGLLLLQFSGCRLGGGADVAAGMFECGLRQFDNLGVRDGRGRVVAHDGGDEQGGPGDTAADGVADMLLAGGARTGRVRSTE
jgi:hypothetical protein